MSNHRSLMKQSTPACLRWTWKVALAAPVSAVILEPLPLSYLSYYTYHNRAWPQIDDGVTPEGTVQ